MNKSLFSAGVGRQVITPPKGIYLIGYGDRVKGNRGVHDDLTATALMLTTSEKTLAIVALDMLCINEFIVDRVRAALPGVELCLCCSHTHSGPVGYADETYPRPVQRYMDDLVEAIARAVRMAEASLKPARLEYAQGEAGIAINRREKTASGEMIIGEDPEGVVDRSLQVVSVLTETDERLATLINFACHGTVWGPDNLFVSADWIGVMRRGVEKELGGLALFLQGATGNLNPKMGWGREDCWQMAVDQGNQVAEAAIKAVQKKSKSVEALPLEIERSEIWLPFETPATTATPPKDYRKKLVVMANLPTWTSFLTDWLLRTRYPWKSRLEAHEGFWATPLRINTLRLGDLALVTFGSEVFTEIGMQVKEKSPAKHTLFASVTDGCIGYLPTDAAHSEGGYEVDLAPYAYRFPGPLARGAETQALMRTRQLLTQLWL